MKIRTISSAVTSAMTAVIIAGIGAFHLQQVDRLAQVDDAINLVKVIGPMSQFVGAMALERGVYNQMLISSQSEHADSKLVLDRVELTNSVFTKTEDALSNAPKKGSSRYHRFHKKCED